MSDDADFAAALMDASIAAGLARVDAAIPAGAPGECDECGERMPRLVAGRCGFCRDGRRPPLSFYERPAPPLPTSKEEFEMPSPSYAARTFTVPVEDAAIVKSIERYASEQDVPLGRACAELITAALAQLAAPSIDATTPFVAVDAGELNTAELFAELGRRLAAAPAPELVTAAVTRAEAAEGQLATVRAQLRGILVGDGS